MKSGSGSYAAYNRLKLTVGKVWGCHLVGYHIISHYIILYFIILNYIVLVVVLG